MQLAHMSLCVYNYIMCFCCTRYTFDLNVSLPSGENTQKAVQILVVSGEPTALLLESVSIDNSLRVTMTAKDIIGDCDVYLESLRTTNNSYLGLCSLVSDVCKLILFLY